MYFRFLYFLVQLKIIWRHMTSCSVFCKHTYALRVCIKMCWHSKGYNINFTIFKIFCRNNTQQKFVVTAILNLIYKITWKCNKQIIKVFPITMSKTLLYFFLLLFFWPKSKNCLETCRNDIWYMISVYYKLFRNDLVRPYHLNFMSYLP